MVVRIVEIGYRGLIPEQSFGGPVKRRMERNEFLQLYAAL